MKLLEAVKRNKGAGYDICDTVVSDFIVGFECEPYKDKCIDSYDEALYIVASELEVESITGSIATCEVYGYIKEHYQRFQEFCDRCNTKRWKMTGDDEESDIVDIAMVSLANLITGNYTEKQYNEFVNIMSE